jgi:hypothetical protein
MLQSNYSSKNMDQCVDVCIHGGRVCLSNNAAERALGPSISHLSTPTREVGYYSVQPVIVITAS